MTTIGERIRIARELRGLEQEQLAIRLGLTGGASTVSRWESGHHLPRLDIMARFVQELQIDGHWLLTGDGVPQIDGRNAREILKKIRDLTH